MPLYEYQCESCGHRFEKIQKFSDPHEDTCPKCAGKMKRLVSSPAIQFKGSGWYITDYAKKSPADTGKAGGSKESSDSKDSTNSKTESKTDSGSKDSSSPTKKSD
jgi:putative FmdB family regulatory protein